MGEEKELLLDTQISPSGFSPEQLKDWAAGKRIFISSTMKDLADDRQISKEVINSIGAQPRIFEDWVKDKDPRAAYLDEVRQCDLYVLLLGSQYGDPDGSGFPPTRQEYNEAFASHKPILILQNYDLVKQRKSELAKWIAELEKTQVVTRYNGLSELKEKLLEGLKEFGAGRMLQWVKIDNMIFAAQHIEESGIDRFGKRNITLQARIKDPRIASSLNEMATRFTNNPRLTYNLDTLEFRRILIKRSSAAAGQTVYTIECEELLQDVGYYSQQRHILAQTLYGNYPYREVIELCIRSILFNQTDERFSGSAISLPSGELVSIYHDWKDEPQNFGLVARFYIVEKLRGNRAIVQSITNLNIGKVRNNKVRIQIGIMPFQDFDRSSELLEIDGYLDLTPPRTKPRAW